MHHTAFKKISVPAGINTLQLETVEIVVHLKILETHFIIKQLFWNKCYDMSHDVCNILPAVVNITFRYK